MDEQTLRIAVAGLIILFILWIGGYAAFSSMRNKVKAVAVAPRQATPWQKALLATAIVLDVYLIARVWVPALDEIVFAQRSPSPFLALAVMAAGGLVMIATHLHMGASWRIGVPQEDSNDIDALVTSGPLGFSRNPIYLGILMMIIGAAVAAPGPLTVIALLVTFIGMQAVIAEEEAYLEQRFGEQYVQYKKRVRRWV